MLLVRPQNTTAGSGLQQFLWHLLWEQIKLRSMLWQPWCSWNQIYLLEYHSRIWLVLFKWLTIWGLLTKCCVWVVWVEFRGCYFDSMFGCLTKSLWLDPLSCDFIYIPSWSWWLITCMYANTDIASSQPKPVLIKYTKNFGECCVITDVAAFTEWFLIKVV